MIQQGDVLFHRQEIPGFGSYPNLELSLNPVIQEGEHTGHAHRILSFRHGDMGAQRGEVPVESVSIPKWKILTDNKTGMRYLKTEETIEIGHEEHKTVTIPPGEYRIGIVKEYDHFEEDARNVAD